jgi:integrase
MTMNEFDSIEYFLTDIEHHGRKGRTISAYRRVLLEFERFLDERFGKTPTDAKYRDCMAFVHKLRSDYEESTVATYSSYLNRFYNYLVRVGRHSENPMELVLEEMNESIESNPERRDISLYDMKEFVSNIRHPLHHAIVLTFLKTGIRSGELCNLDLIDLNLDHEVMSWEPRAQIEKKPDTLYISAEHDHGSESGGTMRTASNKRKRETTIPVDAELKDALVRWIAIRPDTQCQGNPLFTGTVECWGRRLTINIVHHTVENYAREYGWFRTGGGAAVNVTPHYFRHFFTTHLRDKTGDRGIVKYLRGDVASDIIDTYTHNWNDRVRDIYLENIYKLNKCETQNLKIERR